MNNDFRDAERAELAAHLASVPDIDCDDCGECMNTATLPHSLAELLGDVTRDAASYRKAAASYAKFTRQTPVDDANNARWGAFADAYTDIARLLDTYSDAIAHLCELERA